MTLHSNLEKTRLAVSAAISGAFQTPEVIRLFASKQPAACKCSPRRHSSPQVIRLFASKQPAAMRRRLAEMERDVKLGKLAAEAFDGMKSEMLVALKKLGEPLSASEEAFLGANKSASLSEFEAVDDNADQVSQLPVNL